MCRPMPTWGKWKKKRGKGRSPSSLLGSGAILCVVVSLGDAVCPEQSCVMLPCWAMLYALIHLPGNVDNGDGGGSRCHVYVNHPGSAASPVRRIRAGLAPPDPALCCLQYWLWWRQHWGQWQGWWQQRLQSLWGQGNPVCNWCGHTVEAVPSCPNDRWAADASPGWPSCRSSSPATWGMILSPLPPLIMPSSFCTVTTQKRGFWGGQQGLWGRMWLTKTWAEGNKVGEGWPTKNNNQPSMGVVQWWKLMEQAADNKRGQRAMDWTRGNIQQQINNRPLMGVAKGHGRGPGPQPLRGVRPAFTPDIATGSNCFVKHIAWHCEQKNKGGGN